jgi:hypothetical protein
MGREMSRGMGEVVGCLSDGSGKKRGSGIFVVEWRRG